jgi:hypothetical protein
MTSHILLVTPLPSVVLNEIDYTFNGLQAAFEKSVTQVLLVLYDPLNSSMFGKNIRIEIIVFAHLRLDRH